jgi:hypothetical protein
MGSFLKMHQLKSYNMQNLLNAYCINYNLLQAYSNAIGTVMLRMKL